MAWTRWLFGSSPPAACSPSDTLAMERISMTGASARVAPDLLLDSLQVSSFKVKLRPTDNERSKDLSPFRSLPQVRLRALAPWCLLLLRLLSRFRAPVLDFLSSPCRLLLSPESADSGHSRPLRVVFPAEAAEALPGPADVPSRRRAAQQLLLLAPQVRTAALLQRDRVTFAFCRASTTRVMSGSVSLAML